MYLALLLSPESEALLRPYADADQHLHITIVHSKAVPDEAQKNALAAALVKKTLETVPSLSSVALPIVGTATSFTVMGPRTKRVRALEIDSTPFWALRRAAESLLQRLYMPWSTQWNFSPHITLGPLSGVAAVAVKKQAASRWQSPLVSQAFGLTSPKLPQQLTFDRLQWL